MFLFSFFSGRTSAHDPLVQTATAEISVGNTQNQATVSSEEFSYSINMHDRSYFLRHVFILIE